MEMLTGTLGLNACFINFDFKNSRSSQKIVTNISWNKEIILPLGSIIDVKGLLSFQCMRVSEKEHSDYDSSFNIAPQISLIWKWPLVCSSKFASVVFTPIFGVIMAGGKKHADIFEDQFCEINDINFLDGNRQVSSYNVDTGHRICYGIKLSDYKNGENLYRLTIGRSTEISSPPDRSESTGIKYKSSDVVTSCDIFLSDRWTLTMNGNYCPQSRRWSRIETGLVFSDKKYSIDIMAFSGSQNLYDPFSISNLSEEDKKQKYKGLILDTGIYLTNKLKLKNSIIIGNECRTQSAQPSDGGDKPVQTSDGGYKPIKYNIGIEYKNECASVDFVMERKNLKGGDLKPETTFRLIVNLKNLGF